jgi:hypothetical protein
MKSEKPKSYLIRGIPPTLHKRARIAALEEGVTLNSFILDLLSRRVGMEEPKGPKQSRRKKADKRGGGK